MTTMFRLTKRATEKDFMQYRTAHLAKLPEGVHSAECAVLLQVVINARYGCLECRAEALAPEMVAHLVLQGNMRC
jgi:hypothetical protein